MCCTYCFCYNISFLIIHHIVYLSVFFFNDTATTEIYTLSLHDALPILPPAGVLALYGPYHRHGRPTAPSNDDFDRPWRWRSEEHTSELQSLTNLVCRLLLEKKN